MQKTPRRLLCILLALSLLVAAITGISSALTPKAEALENFGFTPANGYCYTSRAETVAQGLLAYGVAASQTTTEVASRIYKLLFEAQYRVTDFGGSLWMCDNYGDPIRSAYDSGLGTTVSWGWNSWGCLSYAYFVSQYVRGTIATDFKKEVKAGAIPSGAEIKAYFDTYADPGEHLHFMYGSAGEHSVIYLASDADGFYFISDNGNSLDIRLYYSTYDYFSSKLRLSGGSSLALYDTNNGKDVPAETPLAMVPEKIAQTEFAGHTYALYNGSLDWAEASDYAQSLGGTLATITSVEEQNAVTSLCSTAVQPFAWIGLSNAGGTAAWNTGEAVVYRNFLAESTALAGKNGFLFNSGTRAGKWNTCDGFFKDGKQSYGDGSFGFIVEYGERFPDAVRAINEQMHNGHRYVLFDGSLTWEEAQAYCASLGGHLVTLNDTGEMELLQTLASALGKGVWVGATADAEAGWQWLSGEKLAEGLLVPAAQENKRLAALTAQNSIWAIGDSGSEYAFICEMDAYERVRGDITGDSKIDAADARQALRISVQLETADEVLSAVGDVTGDGLILADDARLLLRASVQLENLSLLSAVRIAGDNSLLP